MIRRPPRSTLSSSSAASDVYKRQERAATTTETAALTETPGTPVCGVRQLSAKLPQSVREALAGSTAWQLICGGRPTGWSTWRVGAAPALDEVRAWADSSLAQVVGPVMRLSDQPDAVLWQRTALGGRMKQHKDFQRSGWCTSDTRMATALVLMTDVSVANGPVVVYPGTEREVWGDRDLARRLKHRRQVCLCESLYH
eukprot:TRINITY_DN7581_c0_g1_i1.p1 TRINITY_DN7581_c0_g1~~TRINITY_DN7581_c0_g1_i1.p1  ORF type:complete len:198 (+),score=20.98 TRINITY_DN7581_c0_g1_i1:97-690(+)